jgi:hypothetical protein
MTTTETISFAEQWLSNQDITEETKNQVLIYFLLYLINQ